MSLTRKSIAGFALAAATTVLVGCSSTDASSGSTDTGSAPTPESEHTTNEQAYLAVLDDEGIYLGSDEDAVEIGHDACDVLEADSVETAASILIDGGYTAAESGTILGAAGAAFCPEIADEAFDDLNERLGGSDI